MEESKQPERLNARLLPGPPPSQGFFESLFANLCSCCSRLAQGKPVESYGDFATPHQKHEIAQLSARLVEAYDPENKDHVAVLQGIWQSVFPGDEGDAAAAGGGKQRDWGRLGFQQSDAPETDVRGAGMLGLQALGDFVRDHPADARRMVKDSDTKDTGDGYPFAVVSLNATYVLACCLQLLGPAVDKTKVIVPGLGLLSEFEARLSRADRDDLVGFAGLVQRYGSRRAFAEVQAAMMRRMHFHWKRFQRTHRPIRMMWDRTVLPAAAQDIRRMLGRHPETVEEFEFMVREAEGAAKSRLCA